MLRRDHNHVNNCKAAYRKQQNTCDQWQAQWAAIDRSEIDYESPEFENIDWDSIVTEDDTPVENYTTEQHYPLLTTTLYDSWSHSIHGKKFIVVADVGVFSAPSRPPIVPDVFLSLGLLRPN